MLNTRNKPVLAAAFEAVQDIAEPYEGYHAELLDVLTKALQILLSVPGEREQRRDVEELVKGFASEISTRLGES